MKGPGQFLGPVAANLPTGTSDTWSNDISEDALIQRKQENDAEAAAWPTRKAGPSIPKLTLPTLSASLPESRTALDGVVSALRERQSVRDPGRPQGGDAIPSPARSWRRSSVRTGIGWCLALSRTQPSVTRRNVGDLLASYIAGLTSADYTGRHRLIARDWQTEVPDRDHADRLLRVIPTRAA